MADRFDIAIIGAGMAGASAAAPLARAGLRVALLERESQPGYHATGRSAAMYSQTYGNAVIRSLTSAGRAFFADPPDGFADQPLLTPRGVFVIAPPGRRAEVEEKAATASALVASVRPMDGAEARARVPVLRAEACDAAVWEPEASEIDVNALHQGFVRQFRAAGGRVVTDAGIDGVRRHGERWRIAMPGGDEIEAGILVNAAGAWADDVGKAAGASPIGLEPRRRTVVVFDPAGAAADPAWPFVVDIDEQFYFKAESGRILASPADETPCPPGDAQPEEMDIALAIDRVERATTLTARRIHAKWAGLRSFTADRTPTVGFDPEVAGFFWLAGQGGYGIQTAPALGRLAAALIQGGSVPDDLARFGVDAAAMAPARHRP